MHASLVNRLRNLALAACALIFCASFCFAIATRRCCNRTRARSRRNACCAALTVERLLRLPPRAIVNRRPVVVRPRVAVVRVRVFDERDRVVAVAADLPFLAFVFDAALLAFFFGAAFFVPVFDFVLPVERAANNDGEVDVKLRRIVDENDVIGVVVVDDVAAATTAVDESRPNANIRVDK